METESDEQRYQRALTTESRYTIGQYFDMWALQDYDENMERNHVAATTFLNEYLSTWTAPFTYLELGCGNGWLVRAVAQHPLCTRAIGLDLSPLMIAKAQDAYRRNPPHVRFEVADFLQYETTEPFDVVFSMAAVYYVIPMERLRERIAAWVRPGGMFGSAVDIYADNPDAFAHQQAMTIPMDIRSPDAYARLYRDVYELEHVQQRQIPNPRLPEALEFARTVGTLITWGTRRSADRGRDEESTTSSAVVQ